MLILVYLLVALLLLGLNAFFVLAEFAAVKRRPSRTEELAARGEGRAEIVKHVQGRLDECLSQPRGIPPRSSSAPRPDRRAL